MGWDISVTLKAGIRHIDMEAILTILKYQDRCRTVILDKGKFYAIRSDNDSWCLFHYVEAIFDWISYDDSDKEYSIDIGHHHFSSYKGREELFIPSADLDFLKGQTKMINHICSILDATKNIRVDEADDVYYAGSDPDELSKCSDHLLPEHIKEVISVEVYEKAFETVKQYIRDLGEIDGWHMTMSVD